MLHRQAGLQRRVLDRGQIASWRVPPLPIIVLFRNDLRVSDNRALAAAADTGKPVIPLFILDEEAPHARPAGAASRWWLHHSLAALGKSLEKFGSRLFLRRGKTEKIVAEAIKAAGADTVFWNRRYAPWDISVDKSLKSRLRIDGLEAESFDGFLLHEPSLVATQSGDFYKVFTPFYKKLANYEPRDPVDAPTSLVEWKGTPYSEELDSFELLPKRPDWSRGLAARWQPGEDGAVARLIAFLDDRLEGYAENRDKPGEDGTSCLSPHLAHGEITPGRIMAALQTQAKPGCRDFPQRTCVARILLSPAFPSPRAAMRELPSRIRCVRMAKRARCAEGLATWANGISDRRRRHASTLADRLDA